MHLRELSLFMRTRVPDSAISVFCIKMGQIFKASLPEVRNILFLVTVQSKVQGTVRLFGFQAICIKNNLAFIILKIITKILSWLLQAEDRTEPNHRGLTIATLRP